MRTMIRSTELGARTKVFFRVISHPVKWARTVTKGRAKDLSAARCFSQGVCKAHARSLDVRLGPGPYGRGPGQATSSSRRAPDPCFWARGSPISTLAPSPSQPLTPR